MNLKIRRYLIRKPLIIGRITIEVNASDDESGIHYVEFLLNGEKKEMDSTEPYNWTWSQKILGKHTIKVTAYDKAGNSASDEITVWKLF